MMSRSARVRGCVYLFFFSFFLSFLHGNINFYHILTAVTMIRIFHCWIFSNSERERKCVNIKLSVSINSSFWHRMKFVKVDAKGATKKKESKIIMKRKSKSVTLTTRRVNFDSSRLTNTHTYFYELCLMNILWWGFTVSLSFTFCAYLKQKLIKIVLSFSIHQKRNELKLFIYLSQTQFTFRMVRIV